MKPNTKEEIKQYILNHGFWDWYGDSYKKPEAADMDCYNIEDAYMFALTGTPHWKFEGKNKEEFTRIVQIIYPKLQDQDGKLHINVYSQGKHSLGRFLSNFTKHKIQTEDGPFLSIEGYWYFLSCGDEKLRNLHGYQAKKYGRSVRAKDWVHTDDFKRKICTAIETKVSSSGYQTMFKNCKLPFRHYYVFGDKVIEPEEGKWIISFLEDLRERLLVKINI